MHFLLFVENTSVRPCDEPVDDHSGLHSFLLTFGRHVAIYCGLAQAPCHMFASVVLVATYLPSKNILNDIRGREWS